MTDNQYSAEMTAIAGVADALLMLAAALMRYGTIAPADVLRDAEGWIVDRQEKGAPPEIVQTITEIRDLASQLDLAMRPVPEFQGVGATSAPRFTVIPGGKLE